MKGFERWRVLRQLESPDAGVRGEAVERLGAEGGMRDAELLTAFLIHDDKEVRAAAAAALRAIGDAAVPPLLNELRHQYPDMRAVAVDVLGSMKESRARRALMEMVRADEDADVRRRAAAALGGIGGRQALGTLLAAALRDPDCGVRLGATEVIGAVEDRLVAEVLTAQLRDEDADVRTTAARALGRLNADEALLDGLVAALDDSHDGVRHAVGEALDSLGWRPEDAEGDRPEGGGLKGR